MRVLFVLLFFLASFNSLDAQEIKIPSVAGLFYPASKKELHNMITDFLKEVRDPAIRADVVGLISPHAGYVYSGQVAAYAFKTIKGKNYDTVIILGPSHHLGFRGISVWQEGYFRTPLGDVEVDEGASSFILKNFNKAVFKKEAFLREHSVEVQIPFLQTVLKNFKIVPVVTGYLTLQEIEELSSVLFELSKNKNILVVASSDLSHFHSYLVAQNMDSRTNEYIEDMDATTFYNKCNAGEIEACGFTPVTALIYYARRHEARSLFLKYLNSGDTAGDKRRVVGYSAFCFVKDDED